MKFLFVFGLVAAVQAISFLDVSREEWNNFKVKFGKTYKDANEEKLRYKIYLQNRLEIAKHNQRFLLKNENSPSFSIDLNKFADMLNSEFDRTFNGFKRIEDSGTSVWSRFSRGSLRVEEPVTFIGAANVAVPDSIDWREQGAVTDVKDQGQCGSCWAFSATGSLEGQHFRKTGQLLSLSEQDLVDCSTSYGNYGCGGGNVNRAFHFIKDNGGIDTESSYPYQAVQSGSCKFSNGNVGATVTGYVNFKSGDEDRLKLAVATVGPISIAIDASHKSFQFYKSGVYYEPECDSQKLVHAVLIVGYGTDSDTNLDYWLVKNSWGTSWGEKGYIKMIRNKQNACGVATFSSFPLV